MTESEFPIGFVDSNIWLYALLVGQDAERARIAKKLTLIDGQIISSQVINEVCSNLIRKDKYNETQILQLIESFYANCEIIETNQQILIKASELRGRYPISFWDGLIVASALFADAEILYSEDMQNGLLIENKLRIINPF